ncbi:MAG: hypothetical protein GY953_43640, partial [bacterium]|nr:hypothetical protein [bacterium]
VDLAITDNAGVEWLAALFSVADGQVNYLVPAGAATGLARVSVISNGQEVATATAQIHAAAPSLFSANRDGRGVAAAVAVRVAGDGSQTSQLIFECGAEPGSCTATPIDLGADDEQVFLLLFGTGLRGAAQPATATIGGEPVPVQGPVAHPVFPGLDQANLGPLPRTLAGRGEMEIVVTTDTKTANPVSVSIF